MKHWKSYAIGLIALSLACVSPASSPKDKFVYIGHRSPEALRGLKSVSLIVSVIDVEKHHINKEKIQGEVEQRLKRAGLHIFTEKEITEVMRNPKNPIGASLPSMHLYINVNGPPIQEFTHLSLREDVIPARNKKMVVPVDTWREDNYWWRDMSAKGAEESAVKLVDWFCSDYVIGNSKQAIH